MIKYPMLQLSHIFLLIYKIEIHIAFSIFASLDLYNMKNNVIEFTAKRQ